MTDSTVLITGVGLVSSLGIGVDEHIEGLPDAMARTEGGGGRIAPFELEDYLPSRKPYLDRHSALGLLAAALALGEGGIEGTVPCPALSGLAVSTAWGNHASLDVFSRKLMEKGIRLAPPMVFPHTYLNTTASLIAIEFGLRGSHFSFCDGSAGAGHGLWLLWREILAGKCALALAGGADYAPEDGPEGAAFLLLERENGGERTVPPLCRLADVHISSSAGNELQSAEAGVVITTSATPEGQVDLSRLLGETGAARLPLAVGLAALGLSNPSVAESLGGVAAPPCYTIIDETPPVRTVVRLERMEAI